MTIRVRDQKEERDLARHPVWFTRVDCAECGRAKCHSSRCTKASRFENRTLCSLQCTQVREIEIIMEGGGNDATSYTKQNSEQLERRKRRQRRKRCPGCCNGNRILIEGSIHNFDIFASVTRFSTRKYLTRQAILRKQQYDAARGSVESPSLRHRRLKAQDRRSLVGRPTPGCIRDPARRSVPFQRRYDNNIREWSPQIYCAYDSKETIPAIMAHSRENAFFDTRPPINEREKIYGNDYPVFKSIFCCRL